MLIIKRKASESICIGPDISIQILSVSAGAVSLGIQAPREILVRRAELEAVASANLLTNQQVSAESLTRLANALRQLAPKKTS